MKSIVRVLAVAAAVTGMSVYAQDFDDLDEELSSGEAPSAPAEGEKKSSEAAAADASAEEPAPAAEDAAGAAIDIGGNLQQTKSETRYFYTLPTVHKLIGTGDVLKPGAAEWSAAEEGRYYPLGSVFRTTGKDSRMIVRLGFECSVTLIGEATIQTRKQGLEEKSRAVTLRGGIVRVKLPMKLPAGKFTVEAPGFSVVNPCGISSYKYVPTGDGDDVTIRCNTGSLSIKGRHFSIASMRAANEVRIKTSQDVLFTGIYGTRGDYVCTLDQGMVKVTDVETGESHVKPKTLEWKISPQTAVRIHRAVPEIGKNMAVSIMTFDASGNMKNRCAFAENRFEVNSGELAPKTKSGQAELMKKAEEATSDAVAADAETVDTEVAEAAPAAEEKEKPKSDESDDDLDF